MNTLQNIYASTLIGAYYLTGLLFIANLFINLFKI